MSYFKKGLQLLLLAAAVWFTIQNWDVKVDNLSLFTKEIPNASVVFVIFASMLLGALISAFFSSLKEWKNVREHKRKVRDLKSTIKDFELKTKDLQIIQNDLEKEKNENESHKKEIKTLKEVMSLHGKGGQQAKEDKLIDY